MELSRKIDDGVEFYTIELTGQSGMSQSGLAILAGVSGEALRKLEDTLSTSAPSESLKPFAGKSLTLSTSNVTINGKQQGNLKIYKASYCAAVLKHYASEPRSNPIAINSCLTFMEMGINSWIQEITGWKQRREGNLPHTDVYIKRIQHMRDHVIDDDNWCIFREAADLLLLLEKDWRVPINDYDILDGSIGGIWSDYRKNKPWISNVSSYTHRYRDQRGERECSAYVYDELPHFKKWLRDEYVPKYLPLYLRRKYGKQVTRLVYNENGLINDHILELTEVKRKSPKDDERYQKFLDERNYLDKQIPGDN